MVWMARLIKYKHIHTMRDTHTQLHTHIFLYFYIYTFKITSIFWWTKWKFHRQLLKNSKNHLSWKWSGCVRACVRVYACMCMCAHLHVTSCRLWVISVHCVVWKDDCFSSFCTKKKRRTTFSKLLVIWCIIPWLKFSSIIVWIPCTTCRFMPFFFFWHSLSLPLHVNSRLCIRQWLIVRCLVFVLNACRVCKHNTWFKAV